MSVIEFDLGFQSRIVKIGVDYLLVREASGTIANRWQNETSKRSVMRNGEVSSIRNAADLSPMLISWCCSYCDEDGEPIAADPVDTKTICGWPHRVQKSIFEMILEMSDLIPRDDKEEEDDEAKNS